MAALSWFCTDEAVWVLNIQTPAKNRMTLMIRYLRELSKNFVITLIKVSYFINPKIRNY